MSLRNVSYKSACLIVLFHFALIGCRSDPATNTKDVMDHNDQNLSQYVDSKRAYVAALEKKLLPEDPVTSPYRLVAIIGPQWSVGDVFELHNPMSLATTACRAPAGMPPIAPVTWTELPAFSQENTIKFDAGLPSSVLSVIGKDNKLGVNFDLNNGGSVSFTEITSVIAAKDVFENNIVGPCHDYLEKKGGVLVRGVVSARENFNSWRKFNSAASIKLTTDPLFDISYNTTGAFTLIDKAANPKMFVVAYYSPATLSDGSSDGARTLTGAEIAEFESIRISGR